MLRFNAAVVVLLAFSTLLAAQPAGAPTFKSIPIAAPAEPDAISLYATGPLATLDDKRQWDRMVGELGPMHVDERAVRNVTRPTITPVLPAPGTANGAAVIVAPGGAFMSLSIDHEGFNVARWLAARGVTAFVLQYRLLPTPRDGAAFLEQIGKVMAAASNLSPEAAPAVSDPAAGDDALQALRVVRGNAARWHIDPARVGMIGFSAGAMTSMQAVLKGNPAERPSFFGYIYGPMNRVAVPADAPPMFAALAIDDGLFGRQGFGVVEAWHAAGRPVELHVYERGDHGFGMGRPGTTTTLLMDEFYAWLNARGVLGEKIR